MITDLLDGAGVRADTPIPPSSWAFDAKAAPAVAYDRPAAVRELREAGWRRPEKAWIPPRATKPLEVTLLAPERAANPVAFAAATRVAAAWTSLGLATSVEALPPGEFVDRLRARKFVAAVIDVNMGLDPDPYPILASTQAREGGANVSGIQDAALDAALVAARAPGSTAARRRAYAKLQDVLANAPAHADPLLPRQRPRGRRRARRAVSPADRGPGWAILGRGTMGRDRTVTLAARASGRCRGGGTGRRASLRS